MCQESNIKVIMVTWDNIDTASAIAKECGILDKEVDLQFSSPDIVEDDPEAMNDNFRKNDYKW